MHAKHFGSLYIVYKDLSQALRLTSHFPNTGSVIIHQIVRVGATLHIMYVGGISHTDLGPYLPYNHAPQGAIAISKF